MGLDMYLTKRLYLKNWNHTKPEDRHEIIIKKGGTTRTDIETDKISEIIIDVIYWRKANAIHKWFVDNCQGGVDDCRDAYISKEDLKNLYEICCEVLDNSKLVKGKVKNGYKMEKHSNGSIEQVPILEDGKYIKDSSVAKKLLPSDISGCFFGSGEYDQWYYEDIKNTKEMLERELAIPDNHCDYYYHSSW